MAKLSKISYVFWADSEIETVVLYPSERGFLYYYRYTQTQTENQISSDMPSQTGTENLQSDR